MQFDLLKYGKDATIFVIILNNRVILPSPMNKMCSDFFNVCKVGGGDIPPPLSPILSLIPLIDVVMLK